MLFCFVWTDRHIPVTCYKWFMVGVWTKTKTNKKAVLSQR